jgi:hypothetical protein
MVDQFWSPFVAYNLYLIDDLIYHYLNFLIVYNTYASSVLESNEQAAVSIENVLEIEEILQIS